MFTPPAEWFLFKNMFEIFFEKYPEYTIAQKPDKELLGRFEGKLPDQPIDFRDINDMKKIATIHQFQANS